MKLFLRRETAPDTSFVVYDDRGEPVYSAIPESGGGIRLLLVDSACQPCTMIRYNSLMLNYFSIKCEKRFYVLIPVAGEHISFAIYGSTYRFTGDAPSGCFAMVNTAGDSVMSQKKCWCRYGDGYELHIEDEEHKLFLLSTAICADLYLSLSEASPGAEPAHP